MRTLGTTQRLKLLRQRLYALTGFRGHVPLRLSSSGRYTRVTMPDGTVLTPSPLRWKLYKRGWAARLAHIAREFGMGEEYRLSPGDVVIDIGANIGEFASAAAAAGAVVHAFEPDPDAAACFRENTASLPSVTLHQEVLWKEDAEIDFHLSPERADSSAFRPTAAHVTVRRQARTLDGFVRGQGLGRLKLIKCDAEGAEPEVLAGAARALSIADHVAIDTGAERAGERTNQECATLLEAAGFQVMDRKIGTRWITFGRRPNA